MKSNKLKFSLLIAFFTLAINTIFSQTPTADIFAPTFSHQSGRYNSDIQIQLGTRTPNAKIYYTLDGTEPDSSSQQYAGNVSITGNGNYTTLKAITISQDSMKSMVSYAVYLIDYSFNPNAGYLTNLTWTQYNSFIQGDWFGYATTPWTNPYSVKLSILPNGHYIDSTTTSGFMYPFDDDFGTVFYYGIATPSPYKTISLYNILASGYANGYVTIDFGSGSTNQDELRYVKFIDNRNLYLEMWHQSQYGPLKYFLTKNTPFISTGISQYERESTVIYPNPASDFLFIKNLNSNVQFIDQLGQSFVVEKSEAIPVSHLPKGLYVVSFQNSDGTLVKQKVLLK